MVLNSNDVKTVAIEENNMPLVYPMICIANETEAMEWGAGKLEYGLAENFFFFLKEIKCPQNVHKPLLPKET